MEALHSRPFAGALVALVVLAGACGSGDGGRAAGRDEVVVFAAASLRDAMEEVGSGFEAETGTRAVLNFAGSNVLAQQIVAAPGADVFLSASERWMDTVDRAGRLVAGTRRDLLSNSLVVVAHANSAWTMRDACDLAGLDFKYLALGDPEAVPAGRYARAWLESVSCEGETLWQQVSDRVAPGPDVRAALGLVVADPGLVGIVYKTDWRSAAGQTRVLYEVPAGRGPAIRYVLAQVAEGPAPEAARRFLAYLAGADARRVFERHGFTTP